MGPVAEGPAAAPVQPSRPVGCADPGAWPGLGEQEQLQLQLQWRPYAFALPQAMVTSQGAWSERCGWLLRLQSADGRLGWGEAVEWPTRGAAQEGSLPCRALEPPSALPERLRRDALERRLPQWSPPLACALGMALAELDGLGRAERGGWLVAPPSAWLLPAGEAALPALEALLERAGAAPETAAGPSPALGPGGVRGGERGSADPGTCPALTVKWKVAAVGDALERRVLEALLRCLPPAGRLRLDANGGWDRPTAAAWAERLAGDPRLEWLEQPLPPHDQEGLESLAARVPLALDESLRCRPELIERWSGWQVRRPLVEGDPRPLLQALERGQPRLMLSTAFETGIGRRWLQHLAGLQALGPTPTAPGLAPGWQPQGPLFAADPEVVWQAAAAP